MDQNLKYDLIVRQINHTPLKWRPGPDPTTHQSSDAFPRTANNHVNEPSGTSTVLSTPFVTCFLAVAMSSGLSQGCDCRPFRLMCGIDQENLGCSRTVLALVFLVECLASRRTLPLPAHVQSRIMATLGPRDLLRLAVRSDLLLPPTLPTVDHRDRRDPV